MTSKTRNFTAADLTQTIEKHKGQGLKVIECRIVMKGDDGVTVTIEPDLTEPGETAVNTKDQTG